MRIGHGYDVHRFGEGKHIVLGGVVIPHDKGIIAHSDGDVLIHALCDAILGAAGLGDIGKHFPDTDDTFKGVDSRRLLREVTGLIKASGYKVVNADMTVIAQAPRILRFTEDMQINVAEDMEISNTAVNVKATTTEKLGFIGEKKGIAAHAVVLIGPIQEK